MRRLAIVVVALFAAACAQGPGAPSPTRVAPTGSAATASASAPVPSPRSSPSPSATPIATAAPAALSWTSIPVPQVPTAGFVGGLAKRDGPDPLFVAVGVTDYGLAVSSAGGNAHLGTAWISTDGRTWQTGAAIDTAQMLFGVAYGHGRFVAVGTWSGPPSSSSAVLASYAGGGPPGAWTSTDGRHWTGRKLASAGDLYGIAVGSTGFVALGSNPDCGQGCPGPVATDTPIYTSSDGVAWTAHGLSTGQVNQIVGLPAGGFLAVGFVEDASCPEQVASAMWRSEDGAAWTRTAGGSVCGRASGAVAIGGTLLVIGVAPPVGDVAGRALVWTSPDGSTWNDPADLGPFDASAFGAIGGVPVVSGLDGTWEIQNGSIAVKSGGDPVSFSMFAGGIGMGMGSDGAVVAIPQPTP